MKLWFCPKCNSRILITKSMEDKNFVCQNCNETWCWEDVQQFGIGLSSFDVAEVHDYLEKRVLNETRYIISQQEHVLLVAL